MTLTRWIAETRARLGVCVLIGYALLFAPALPLTDHIRHTSTSPTLDMLLLLLVGAVLLTVSYLTGILAGDFLFPARWRERVILGRDLPLMADDDGLVDLRASKTYRTHFYALVAALAFGGGMLYEQVTDHFFAEYQRVGHMHTIIRGDNQDAKLELVKELADARIEVRTRDAIALLDATWHDEAQPDEIRLEALTSLGRLGASLVTSVDSWLAQGERNHWEFDVVRDLRRDLTGTLTQRFPTEADPRFAVRMAMVVGKLRAMSQVKPFAAYVKARRADAERRQVWLAAVVAIGLMRDIDGLDVLVEIAPEVKDPKAFAVLAWAVGELTRTFRPPDDGTAPPIFQAVIDAFQRLAAEGEWPRRCAAAAVFTKLGDARIPEPIFALFDSDGADGSCGPVHADLGNPAEDVVLEERPYQFFLLQGLSHVAVGNDEVLQWAQQRRDDPRYSDFIRGEIARLITLIEAKQTP